MSFFHHTYLVYHILLEVTRSTMWNCHLILIGFMYCLKHEQQCFIGFKNTRRSRVFLNPIKHVLRVFWTASKIASKIRDNTYLRIFLLFQKPEKTRACEFFCGFENPRKRVHWEQLIEIFILRSHGDLYIKITCDLYIKIMVVVLIFTRYKGSCTWSIWRLW